MLLSLIKQSFKELGIPYKDEWDKLFITFFSVYTQTNEKINISTIKTPHDFVTKHIIDSACAFLFFKDSQHVIDLGSGGGFPGIVLAILYPHIRFSLIDVIKKKTDYLKILISELKLNNCKAYNASQEKMPNKSDTLTCRALSSLKKIVALSKPYLKANGKILAYKGTKETIEKELKELPSFVKAEINFLKTPSILEAERHMVTLTFS